MDLFIRDDPWEDDAFRRSLRDGEIDALIDLVDDGRKLTTARFAVSPEAWVAVGNRIGPGERWLLPPATPEATARRRRALRAVSEVAEGLILGEFAKGNLDIDVVVTSADRTILDRIVELARGA